MATAAGGSSPGVLGADSGRRGPAAGRAADATMRSFTPSGAPAGPARDTGDLGPHTVRVQPVYWTATPPTGPDPAVVQGVVRDTSAYFRAMTKSRVTVSLRDYAAWSPITLSAAEQASCDTTAIEREVRRLVPSLPTKNDHLAVLLPATTACQFGTLASFGPTAAGGGIAFFNGDLEPKGLTFAVGSNMGLGVASARDCWTDAGHSATTPLSAFCKDQSGGDPWDPMGNSPYGQMGQMSAANLAEISALDAAGFPELTPGTPQYLFVRPLTSYTGLRGFGVTIGRHRFTVEYRTVAGADSWIADQTWTSGSTTWADPGGGVVVRYRDLESDSQAESYVLDFHADGVVSPTGRHPGMEAGQSWTSPGNLMRLDVLSTASTGASIKVTFPGLTKVERWSGKDRFAVSAVTSARTFAPGVAVAYVASGQVYPDALSGAPVAGMNGGPILLVDTDSVPGVIQAELRRLHPARIVVLGGPATVSDGVVSKLVGYTTGGVSRWSGADRFATSATISANSFAPGVPTAYIASGRVFTDALSGAPVAGKNDSPVLLVDTTTVPAPIAAELTRLRPGRIVIFGGTTTVSTAVETRLRSFTSGQVVRWSGPDRFAASAAISSVNYGPGVSHLFIASGRVFPDALSGAPVAGLNRGPILLVDTDRLPSAVSTEIQRLQPKRIIVLGGPSTVSEAVRASLGSFLP